MHVLIVDDENGFRRALEKNLQLDGHTTCWASTGHGALRLLFTEPIDVVILDMKLPDMSGWDVARIKYADPELRPIPLIVISGIPVEEVKQISRTDVLEDAAIFSKPFDTIRLLRMLKRLSPLSRFRDTSSSADETKTKP